MEADFAFKKYGGRKYFFATLAWVTPVVDPILRTDGPQSAMVVGSPTSDMTTGPGEFNFP